MEKPGAEPSGDSGVDALRFVRYNYGPPPISTSCGEGRVPTATPRSELDALVAGQTVASRFLDLVEDLPDAVALRWKVDDRWRELTWTQYLDAASRAAGGLAALGVGPGDRVALFMRNRPEFHILDTATLLLGATPFSIYNSSAPDEIAYLLGHSGAGVVIAEDDGFLGRVRSVADRLPALRHVVLVDSGAFVPDGVHTYGGLLEHEPVSLDAARTAARPEDLATIIYTSGTTGPPKGVMISHRNVLWMIEAMHRCLPVDPHRRRIISYLPMAHIAERIVSHYLGVCLGCEVTTCPEPNLVTHYLTEVRPELFFAVPRIWEKAYATIMSLATQDPARAEVFERALEVGFEASEFRARGEHLPADLAAEFERVDGEVLHGIRILLGLDQCAAALTSAAPIPPGILRFFRGLGVPISEAYGLSESTGAHTWTPERVRLGTVGQVIPGGEIELAPDGEVLLRGGNIFLGYLDDPAKTAEVLDADGWFHTGDIGELDADGYLKVIDRKKELIITAGGKNISPANIEAALKAHPMIGQACVIGDQRPYLVALIVPDPEYAHAWAVRNDLADLDLPALAAHPRVRAEVQAGVDAANAQFARVEQIKRFVVLGAEWAADSALLTPTMKLKRRGINEAFADEIENLYT